MTDRGSAGQISADPPRRPQESVASAPQLPQEVTIVAVYHPDELSVEGGGDEYSSEVVFSGKGVHLIIDPPLAQGFTLGMGQVYYDSPSTEGCYFDSNQNVSVEPSNDVIDFEFRGYDHSGDCLKFAREAVKQGMELSAMSVYTPHGYLNKVTLKIHPADI